MNRVRLAARWGDWRPWLIALPGVLAIALNAAALRSGWLSNVAYIYLDGLVNRPGRPWPPTIERWFEAADEAAGQARFETSYGLGLLYLAQDRYPEAISALQAALDADPGFSGAHALLGDAYDGLGNDAIAVTEWQAGQAEPLLMARGAEQGRASRWSAAIHWDELATRVDPNSAAAFSQLGQAYSAAGQRPEALAALLRAVSLAPDDIQIRHVLGLTYLNQGNWTAAAEQFQRVLAQSPNDFYTNLYMSTTQLLLGQLPAAETYARKAMDLSPSDPRGHIALGFAYFRDQRWAPAIDELSRGLALVGPWNRQSSTPISRKDQASDTLLLAQAYQAAGQVQPAIAAYQAVLSLQPDNAAARAALQALPPAGQP